MAARRPVTRACAVLVAALAVLAAWADEYSDARADLVAAYQAKDFPAMVAAAERALDARPQDPGATYNLALSNALNGAPRTAFDLLQVLLQRGIDFGAHEMDEFAALRDLPGWPAYERAVRKLYEPVGNVAVELQLEDGQFVPEGIAVDADGAIYLGSIRRGTIYRNADILVERGPHWSVFGARFHRDGSLWFASAAIAQLDGVGDEIGRTGLFRLDPDSGKTTRVALLPDSPADQLLGDLVIAGDVIYTTDSLTGAVYRYDMAENAFTVIVEPGILRSPQGLAPDASGNYLYIADYRVGVFRLALATGRLERLQLAAGITDYGIDGLYRVGDQLIAIQNGIRPHRVSAFRLDETGLAIDAHELLAANLPTFDEPTLGAVHGDRLYFVANSHWNRFDAENRLPDGLSGPIVLSVALPHDPVLDKE